MKGHMYLVTAFYLIHKVETYVTVIYFQKSGVQLYEVDSCSSPLALRNTGKDLIEV